MSVFQESTHDGIQSFDYGRLEEMDPSLADGYSVIYEREVSLEVRHQQENEEVGPGLMESLRIKMLVQGDTPEVTRSVRVEFSSEADLFFQYVHEIDEEGYGAMQQSQKLMLSFPDYPNVLIRMFNHCIKEPQTHLGIFTMMGESDARLDFIQNMEYKFVELMSCEVHRASDEMVQQQITFRYNAMKQRMTLMASRLYEINTLLKTKNPSLLLQIQKSLSPSQPNGGYTEKKR